ncbi:GlsB/YeaQ/YmgE family stress response membrane protein [Vagococcus carniphilus]|uniref:GlsB/YeaQ/YmgE family stress response membrane protein n=1 Tax=Vagococcus carniphilus TaxID=218144 RepID=A0A430B4Z0_9ENTE|nr:GlsB/YeaQ/YmgE family stress response membrane protein [Vagococcus carniphilus]MDT2815835.1 GlsB/YeaQ/YmgE family stress response membrane protein [Vagococcus carniphilus]MDT2829654.1 GlsB/YeaQ/YmgE family stress response membrane protein [Vagococcus carniphilus]MDT2839113.1 GlsB/YeaQ/YmgE family stress response membrane protein [Vagococcus carniphilus]MDT2853171.1 GlsB/YeaQ/YmgE family stress response membrane protein [Vagococcus carniphilus]QNN71802.1 GlsB/YeaQ/YmgE family stress response
MYWIWVLVVGAVIGAIAGGLVDKGNPKGCVFNIIAGLIGSTVGHKLFGSDWGGHLAGMALVPSILGAVIVVAVVSMFTRK